jgi:hypothetical protein
MAKKLGCDFEAYEINSDYVKLGNSWLESIVV